LNIKMSTQLKGGMNSAGSEDNSSDALMILLKNNPVIFGCFVCLALYGLSMFSFYQRDLKSES